MPVSLPTRLETFLQAQQITPDQWDLLLFGDGSGLGWDVGGGYVVFLVDSRIPQREMLLGGRSKSTVNRMELSAYTEALSYHYYGLLDGVIAKPPYNVWIFTDSELTARVANKQYVRKSNADLWNLVDWYETRGYRLHWRHIERNTTPFHVKADELAGKVRKAILDFAIPSDKLYEIMPYTEPDATTAEIMVCSKCNTPVLAASTVCPICGQPMERKS